MKRVRLADLLASPGRAASLSALLSRGGLAAVPTETFYALAADPTSEPGVRRVLALKRRGAAQPLLVLVAARSQLGPLGVSADPPVLDRFFGIWPAPLTVVFPLRRPIPASRDAFSLGVRVPARRGAARAPFTRRPRDGHQPEPFGETPCEEADDVARQFPARSTCWSTAAGLPAAGRPRSSTPRSRRRGCCARARFRGRDRAKLRAFMGLLKEYAGKRPVVGSRVYLAETAAVIGDVVLGDDVSIWYNAVVRGLPLDPDQRAHQHPGRLRRARDPGNPPNHPWRKRSRSGAEPSSTAQRSGADPDQDSRHGN